MLVSLISAASSVCVFLAIGEGARDCWDIDKKVVTQGGCVTIVVQKPCNESRNLAMKIDERQAVKLLEGVGPDYHRRTSRLPGREDTLVLLFQDLSNPEGLEEVQGEPGTFRWVPVFDEPGEVRLTLYDGEESLGTKTVSVIPCSPEGRKAIELLYPRLANKKRSSQDDVLWSRLVMERSFGLTPPLTEHEIQLLREQLPIMKRHPDWAEIAEMRLAHVETLHYIRQVSEDGGARLRDDVEAPEFPKVVTECMTRSTQSPFAQAIQDDVRDTSALLTYLLKDREGERAANRRP